MTNKLECSFVTKLFQPSYGEKSVWLHNLLFAAFIVTYKSYRHVLTPVNNFQLFLKLPILSKFRLVTFYEKATQRNYSIKTGSNQFRRNKSSHDLDSQSIIVKTSIVKCTLFPQ